MFISGGENIHPEEIERVLLEHPAVTQAMVVGVEDAKWGRRPVAIVESTLNQQQIQEYLRELLPTAKVPKQVERWPSTIQGLKPSRERILSLTQAD